MHKYDDDDDNDNINNGTKKVNGQDTVLRQKTIAITRSEDDAAEFISMARAKNARVHALPTIQLISKGQKIVQEFLDAIDADSPDYAVFMSSKAVKLLFDTARATDSDDSAKQPAVYDTLRLAVANMTVVAVGPKTSEALAREGIKVNEMPAKTYSSVGIGEVFTRLNATGRRAIIPRSGASTPFLKKLLEKIGLEVTELHLYDVCTFSDTTKWNGFREEFAGGRIDGIVFTSASSVRGFADIMSRDYNMDDLLRRLQDVAVVAIGPFTADELKKTGIACSVTSDTHTVAGSFETLSEILELGK